MKSNARSNRVMFLVLLVATGLATGFLILRAYAAETAGAPAAVKGTGPATVTKAVKEQDLNVVTLTDEAIKRIGLSTAAVKQEHRARTVMHPGEVVPPPGASVVVTALVAGTLRAADAGSTVAPNGQQRQQSAANALQPGAKLSAGQPVLGLVPELTGEARATIATSLVDAEGQVKNAEVQRAAAKVALERAKQLLADRAGPQRTVDEAQAVFDLAEQAVKAGEARTAMLARAAGQSADGSVAPIPVVSPIAGVVTAVRVTPGQVVPAGTPLFEVLDSTLVWVKVTVSAADAPLVARNRPARVARLGELAKATPADRAGLTAEPTGAPPVGVAATSAIELTYQLPNPAERPLLPGERVAATLTLAADEESLVLPWSAVIYDLHGGARAYEVTGPRQYARRRVDVRFIDGADAVLRSGPPVGTEVVAEAAIELFGREMGFAK